MITRVEARKAEYPLAIMWTEWKGGKCEYHSAKPRELRSYVISQAQYDRYKIFKSSEQYMDWVNNFRRDERIRDLFISEFKKFTKKSSTINKLLSILW